MPFGLPPLLCWVSVRDAHGGVMSNGTKPMTAPALGATSPLRGEEGAGK
jgi:hypothetical protein